MSFVATAVDLTVEGTNVLRSCKYAFGYDGTSIYCAGQGDFSDRVVILDFTDSKFGLIWGTDFYPVDDTFIYASKPIYAPFLFGSLNIFRGVSAVASGLFPCNVGGTVYISTDLSTDAVYFDGTYIYKRLRCQFAHYDCGSGFAFMQKQILKKK